MVKASIKVRFNSKVLQNFPSAFNCFVILFTTWPTTIPWPILGLMIQNLYFIFFKMSLKLTSTMRGWKKFCKVEKWCQMGFQTQHMVN
jgi:hypothetical protein